MKSQDLKQQILEDIKQQVKLYPQLEFELNRLRMAGGTDFFSFFSAALDTLDQGVLGEIREKAVHSSDCKNIMVVPLSVLEALSTPKEINGCVCNEPDGGCKNPDCECHKGPNEN